MASCWCPVCPPCPSSSPCCPLYGVLLSWNGTIAYSCSGVQGTPSGGCARGPECVWSVVGCISPRLVCTLAVVAPTGQPLPLEVTTDSCWTPLLEVRLHLLCGTLSCPVVSSVPPSRSRQTCGVLVLVTLLVVTPTGTCGSVPAVLYCRTYVGIPWLRLVALEEQAVWLTIPALKRHVCWLSKTSAKLSKRSEQS